MLMLPSEVDVLRLHSALIRRVTMMVRREGLNSETCSFLCLFPNKSLSLPLL